MRLIVAPFLLISALLFDHEALARAGVSGNADTSFPITQLSPNSLIYNGNEYAKVYTPASGHPFFRDQAMNGWVDGYQNRYENIPIYYDIESDWVVFNEPVNKIRISLVNEKIDGFMIDGHRFIALRDATGFRGFYEGLNHGRRQVLVKWFKILTRRGTEEGKYITYSNVYIQEDSNLVQISNKKDLINYFGKNKKKMQQYYQEQHLNIRKDPAHTVSSMVSFAEQNGF
jgi:hypothetical protein